MTSRDVLNVVCFKWRGWRSVYKSDHVNALRRMLQAHLHCEHRLICITDDPKGVECETYPLWDNPVDIAGRNNYTKLKLFDIAEQFGDRILYLDLDCLILDDITPLVQYQDDFITLRGKKCPYNTSLMLFTAGLHKQIWKEFDPVKSPEEISKLKYYGTDQAWLAHILPGIKTLGREHGIYMYTQRNRNIEGARIVFFPIATKPWQMKQHNPAIYSMYKQYL